MAKESQRVKQARGSQYQTRAYHRCARCGRARGYYRKFGVCRICFRSMASDGLIPGVRKASW